MILSNQRFNWLDLIPNQWVVDKVKDHFYFSDIQTEHFVNYPVLSLTMSGVKKRNMDTNEGQLPESYEKYNLVDSSCLVFNPMDLISGWVDVPKTEGLISPSYRTIKPRSEKTNLHFIKYYFQSLYKEKVLFHFGEGVHYEYRWGLGKETLKNFPIPIPPKEEQEEIVSYLNKKTTHIDELIKKIEQKIELLKEQKNSLINEVVTKGLNPKVETKNSGTEWIGEIPSHWDVMKLKYLSRITPSSVDKHIFDDEIQVSVCNYTHVYYNNFINTKVSLDVGSCTENEFSKFKLYKDDVIITKDSETPDDIGIPTLVSESLENTVCGYHLTIIRPEGIKGGYLFRFILSERTRRYFEINSNGVTRFGLGKPSVENLVIPLPTEEEQEQIITYLDHETQIIDDLIFNEQKRIDLLKEYKQSLISEVVTGKKRVVG